MQLRVAERTRHRVPNTRLADIEGGLGIAGSQQAAWNVFIETFLAVQALLDSVDRQGAVKLAERAPSLPDLLRVQKAHLAAQLEASRLLNAITESLYRTLNERQRTRADRLLLPLFHKLALSNGVQHRLPR